VKDRTTYIYGRFCSCDISRVRYYGKTTNNNVTQYINAQTTAFVKKGDRPVALWAKKHIEMGHSMLFKIVETVLSGDSWEDREMFWISTLSTQDRLNATLGGDGAHGAVRSDETKKKMAAAASGRTHSEETKAKISKNHVGMSGKKLSTEAKQKISASHAHRTTSEATRKKMSMAMTGKKWSQERKDAASVYQSIHNNNFKGKTHSEESRKKISDGVRKHNAANPMSQEQKDKISASLLGKPRPRKTKK
jgi:NUMOD3 motif